jgi:hypothetical protein
MSSWKIGRAPLWYRREEQRLFAGTYLQLVDDGKTLQIATKRADLVNCDAPLDSSSRFE